MTDKPFSLKPPAPPAPPARPIQPTHVHDVVGVGASTELVLIFKKAQLKDSGNGQYTHEMEVATAVDMSWECAENLYAVIGELSRQRAEAQKKMTEN